MSNCGIDFILMILNFIKFHRGRTGLRGQGRGDEVFTRDEEPSNFSQGLGPRGQEREERARVHHYPPITVVCPPHPQNPHHNPAMNMSKLRRSLMRSRTPTGAEMKQQNSLEVPPQIRSASFDEMQLKPGRRESSSSSSSPAERQPFLLRVPYLGPKRSKSFDSGCGDVDDSYPSSRKRCSRPPSLDKTVCVHCAYIEEIARRNESGIHRMPYAMSMDFTSLSSSREADEEDVDEDEIGWDDDTSSDELNEVVACGIKVTLSPNSPSSSSPTHDISLPPSVTSSPRSKQVSPKLERQPAIFCMNTSTELSSQENSFDLSDGICSPHGSFVYLGSSSEYGDTGDTSANPPAEEPTIDIPPIEKIPETVAVKLRSESFLAVPHRRDRAASLDVSFSSFPHSDKLSKVSGSGLTRSCSLEPPISLRSKSIDIELPTDFDGAFKDDIETTQTARYFGATMFL